MQNNEPLRFRTSSADQEQLQIAFAAFNEASQQLSGVYQELQCRVAELTHELALANGELHKQLLAKEDLSKKLSFLLNALPGGVVALNAEGRVEQVNPAAVAMIGEPLLGQVWQKIVEGRLSATNMSNEWYVRNDHVTADKIRIRIESSAADSTGRQILLINDITQAYLMQENVKRNQRLTAMGEMAANLAHQLRTPLATALLYATHLGSNSLTAGDRQKFAAKTVDRLHHLESLTKDMLRFVKGETAQLEDVAVTDILLELQQVIEPQLVQHGLQLVVRDHSQGAILKTDRQALFGAVMSLLENAMQASPEGGQIVLASEMDENTIFISVSDDGPGVSPELQERLFEPFFTTRAQGTGLGLAIVRGVIQSMGGTVHIHSRLKAGSEFLIRLPRTRNQGV